MRQAFRKQTVSPATINGIRGGGEISKQWRLEGKHCHEEIGACISRLSLPVWNWYRKKHLGKLKDTQGGWGDMFVGVKRGREICVRRIASRIATSTSTEM